MTLYAEAGEPLADWERDLLAPAVEVRLPPCEPWRAFPSHVVQAFERFDGNVNEVITQASVGGTTTYYRDGRVETKTYAKGGEIEGPPAFTNVNIAGKLTAPLTDEQHARLRGTTFAEVRGRIDFAPGVTPSYPQIGGYYVDELDVADGTTSPIGPYNTQEQQTMAQRKTHLFTYTGAAIAAAINRRISALEDAKDELDALDLDALEGLGYEIAQQARGVAEYRRQGLESQIDGWRAELAGYEASPRKPFDLDVDDVRHFGLSASA